MKVFVPISKAYSHTIDLIYCKTDKYVAAPQILSQFSTHCRRQPGHLSNSFQERKTILQNAFTSKFEFHFGDKIGLR